MRRRDEFSIWNAVARPQYLSKKLILFLLCVIHDHTRYQVCRRISDLFYWPDGFCLDMIVVGLFGIVFVLSSWDDIQIMKKAVVESIIDIKELFRDGFINAFKLDPFEDDDVD